MLAKRFVKIRIGHGLFSCNLMRRTGGLEGGRLFFELRGGVCAGMRFLRGRLMMFVQLPVN